MSFKLLNNRFFMILNLKKNYCFTFDFFGNLKMMLEYII